MMIWLGLNGRRIARGAMAHLSRDKAAAKMGHPGRPGEGMGREAGLFHPSKGARRDPDSPLRSFRSKLLRSK
jgi:hypothetical protein